MTPCSTRFYSYTSSGCSSPHLGFVCCHVSVQLLGLVVRRAVSSEPHVERLLSPPAAVANGEDLDIFRQRLQEFSQHSTQTGEATLLVAIAVKKLLHRQIWKKRRDIRFTSFISERRQDGGDERRRGRWEEMGGDGRRREETGGDERRREETRGDERRQEETGGKEKQFFFPIMPLCLLVLMEPEGTDST